MLPTPGVGGQHRRPATWGRPDSVSNTAGVLRLPATTLYRLAVTFRPDAAGGTQVTVTGQAKDQVREAILRYADEIRSAG